MPAAKVLPCPRHLSATHKGSSQADPLGCEEHGRDHALPWQVWRAVLEFIRELLSSGSRSCWPWDVVGHIFSELRRTSEQDPRGFDRCLTCAESFRRHPWPWGAPRCRAISASAALEVASKRPFLVGVCADTGGGVRGCPQAPSAAQGLLGDEHPPSLSADGQRAERWARLEELSVMFPSNHSLRACVPPGKGTGCLAAPLVAFPAGCGGDEGWGWPSLPLTCRGASLWPELPSGWEICFAPRLGEGLLWEQGKGRCFWVLLYICWAGHAASRAGTRLSPAEGHVPHLFFGGTTAAFGSQGTVQRSSSALCSQSQNHRITEW